MPFDYTGSFSGSFTGDLTSTNGVVSSSAQVTSLLPSGVLSSSAQLSIGVISSSTQVNYTQLQNKPVTISPFQKNSIIANNHFRETTFPTISASFADRIESLENGTDLDQQTLSFNSSTNALTISNGNSVDLSSLAGGVGGSGLAITASDEGSVLSENVRSIDFVGNAVTATNSGNAITVTINTGSVGASTWTELTGKPSGLVSGSSQITDVITDSYISASAAASGFGQGGSPTDISALNTFTGSIQSEVDSLTAATSSYLTSLPSGVVSGSTQITDVVTDSYISASAAASGFGSGGGTTYTAGPGILINGAVISIDTSSTHFRLGVSGAAASYGFGSGGGGSFGDPPVIDSHGFEIAEFTGSNALVGTLTATDPTPGDTQTWATQSGYSAGFFSVSTSGVVRTILTSSTAMNTDNTPGSGSHPLLVQVTDGQNNTVQKTIYIRVVPNSAPVFRIGGVGGSSITSFTASLDESSSAATKTQYRIYVTDADSDTITIRTGSLGTDHFSFSFGTTGVSKYIDLVQVTSSLDYENQTSYSFVLTASDAKYEAGYDTPSITYLPYRVEVVDNLGPGIQDQSISGVNENSSDGTSAGSIVAADNSNPANTILYKNFTLVSAYLDGVGTNITSSLGGTSLTDPTADAFQSNISGVVTRRSSVFLNSDIANRYVYRVNVGDAYNADTASALITIPIADDTVSSIGSDGQTYYTLESSVQGDNLTTNSNGYTISNVTLTSGVSQRWEVNTVPSGFVRFTTGGTTTTGSTVTLEVDSNISGSAYVGGNTIAIQITASEDGFYTTKQYRDHTLSIVQNSAPVGTYSPTSANLNTNGARSGNTLYTLTWTDTESDSLEHSTLNLTSNAGITSSWNGGYIYTITATGSIAAGTYYISASIKDEHGFRTGEKNTSFTITQATTGTLTTNGTFYVIESATSGAFVYTSTNGRSGTRGDLGVTYSPQYNSAAVASFTSSNALVGVTKGGLLSVGNVSQSGYTYDSGTPITSNITWRDQYDNVGGPTQISINVAINNAPTATLLTDDTNNWNTNLATNGTRLSRFTWSDAESDSINVDTFSLSGTGAGLLSSSYLGSNVFGIYANGNLTAGTYSYTASIKDTHGFHTGTYKDIITIAQAGGGTINSENFYIIESALSGASITNDTDGIGSAANVNVSYSPSYGSQTAQQFNTNDSVVAITTAGVLSVKQDISGSYNGGSSLSPTIYWLDQYGNEGTGSITINITNNAAATATFTDESLTAPISQGTKLVTISISDTEGDSPYSVSLSGLSANSMSLSPQNAASSSWFINASNNAITGGTTLYYTASITDAYGETTTDYKRQLVIGAPTSAGPLWYAYIATAGLYGVGSESEGLDYFAEYGGNGTPASGYLFYDFQDGAIGDTLIQSTAYNTLGDAGENTYLVASGSILSGSNSVPFLSDLDQSYGLSPQANSLIIVFPSSSENGINPSSMVSAIGGSVSNQYLLYADRVGTGIVDAPQSAWVKYYSLNSGTYPNSVATSFGVIFTGDDATTDITYFLMAASGSAPSSTQ